MKKDDCMNTVVFFLRHLRDRMGDPIQSHVEYFF